MNKLNWIFALLLAAGLTISPFSIAQATFTDSLHYRFSSDTAVWNEELGAYTVDIDFELKWDEPGDDLSDIVLVFNYSTSFFRHDTITVDSLNWQSWFGVVFDDTTGEVGTVAAEWHVIGALPDTAITTGDFVRFGILTFTVSDQSSQIEGGMAFKRTVANHATIERLFRDMLDSNYVEGTPVFLGIAETPCCNSPGDANNDGQINIADVTHNISRIFAGGPAAPCMAEADADANATLNIADVTFMIARIFAGGPAPSCVSTIP